MEQKNNFLENKTALIIGGTGGIGLGIAKELAKKNVSLILQGGHSLKKLQDALFLCTKVSTKDKLLSTKHSGFILDLSFQKNIENIFKCEELSNALNSCDILVLSHGALLQKDILESSVSDWENIVFSNLTIPGIFISKVIPHFISQKFGKILCLGGTRTDSVRGFKTNPIYGAAKTGLSSLVKSVAQKYSKDSITCNLLCPGFVETEYLSQNQKDSYSLKMPLKKLISVEEISQFAVSILESSSLNGALVNFDQGWSPNFFET